MFVFIFLVTNEDASSKMLMKLNTYWKKSIVVDEDPNPKMFLREHLLSLERICLFFVLFRLKETLFLCVVEIKERGVCYVLDIIL